MPSQNYAPAEPDAVGMADALDPNHEEVLDIRKPTHYRRKKHQDEEADVPPPAAPEPDPPVEEPAPPVEAPAPAPPPAVTYFEPTFAMTSDRPEVMAQSQAKKPEDDRPKIDLNETSAKAQQMRDTRAGLATTGRNVYVPTPEVPQFPEAKKTHVTGQAPPAIGSLATARPAFAGDDPYKHAAPALDHAKGSSQPVAASAVAPLANLPSLVCSVGSPSTSLSDDDIQAHLIPFLEQLGPRDDVLILPPDYTRLPSQAGKITRLVSEHYNFTGGGASSSSSSSPNITILPALGTHAPMTHEQIKTMFGEDLATKNPNPFVVHDWRKDVVTIGHAPADMIKAATNGMVEQEWPVQLNQLVWEKRLSNHKNSSRKPLVLSIGQVVPHEVMGMANFNKNLFVGVGGVEAINMSHFIGAVYGMENMMGRANNPLRSILNHASEKFLQHELDLWYILTVMGTNPASGALEVRGFYIGNDIECYNRACDLSLQVNFTLLDRPMNKVVVHLDEDEYNSTWLGNKSIYRTRMAIADGGEIIVLAPGVSVFGEDGEIDALIRKYGYVGTPKVLEAMKQSKELEKNLSAVAHLIHGSSEGRFRVTYCPGHLTKKEIEGVGFQYGDLESMKKLYDPTKLKDGWNQVTSLDGKTSEEIFYISNPALGLWSMRSRFEQGGKLGNVSTEGEPISVPLNQNAADGSGGVGGWAKPAQSPAAPAATTSSTTTEDQPADIPKNAKKVVTTTTTTTKIVDGKEVVETHVVHNVVVKTKNPFGFLKKKLVGNKKKITTHTTVESEQA